MSIGRKTFRIDDRATRLEAKNAFDGNLVFGARRFHEGTHRSGKGGGKAAGAMTPGPADGAIHAEQSRVVVDTGSERWQRIPEHFEPVDHCPVCRSPERSFFVSRFALDVYECGACTHNYMAPRIKFGKLVELYAHDQTAAKIYTSGMQKEIDQVKSHYGLDLIDQLKPPAHDKIMDLGCGSGEFLHVAHSRGWKRCIGVDANDEFRPTYEEKPGVQFISSTFEALAPDALGVDYDVISMWNVLEHLYDLDSLIASLKRLLKPGGLLFIMVPNVRSLATRIIRERSATFNWKHVSHFTPRSLERLMNDRGLATAHLETAISEIENVKSYLSGAWPYSGYGDPEGLFEFITPGYLHDNMLGSRIIGIFRR